MDNIKEQGQGQQGGDAVAVAIAAADGTNSMKLPEEIYNEIKKNITEIEDKISENSKMWNYCCN